MKACLAIGVNRVAGAASLPTLAAAASGANQFAAWARAQGFDAQSLTDLSGPVTVPDIFSRIDAIVRTRNCTQLIVYFAGHGILKSADTELWLLSAAASDVNAAVNLVGSVRVARKSGIPHLVFISDACRSIATDAGLSEVTGSSIFPTEKVPRKSEVDIFYATMPGDVSWEVPATDAAQRYDGIFTRCLLTGLSGTEAGLVESVPGDNGASLSVVSSRTLKPWIEEKVPDAVWKVDIKLAQFPEMRVESQRPKYLALVTAPALAAAPAPPPPPASATLPKLGRRLLGGALRVLGFPGSIDLPGIVAPLGAVTWAPPVENVPAREKIQRKLDRVRPTRMPIGDTGHRVKISRLDPAFTREAEAFLDAPVLPALDIQTGFSVSGAELHSAFINGRSAEPGDIFFENDQWNLRVQLNGNELLSALIRFGDGSGTCLAVVPGLIGSIVVEDGRVASVSYSPSQSDPRFSPFESDRAEIEERRSLAAAASKRGYFRVEPAEAENYARNLRSLKWLDPALGLYSAYAYDQSGLSDGVLSVYQYMVEDGFVPFDVALLAGKLEPEHRRVIAPFCPMLTQGWSLLGEADADAVSPAVREAARFLRPALWTTLTEKGVETLRNQS